MEVVCGGKFALTLGVVHWLWNWLCIGFGFWISQFGWVGAVAFIRAWGSDWLFEWEEMVN